MVVSLVAADVITIMEVPPSVALTLATVEAALIPATVVVSEDPQVVVVVVPLLRQLPPLPLPVVLVVMGPLPRQLPPLPLLQLVVVVVVVAITPTMVKQYVWLSPELRLKNKLFISLV